ncbi:hypothetical protein ALQ87_102004 [Pseudomonas savastanoi pv. glycinea]|nr:hypothetical protein ALQ87_102004 [Pseudomonas savastanoi pv. glycinea]
MCAAQAQPALSDQQLDRQGDALAKAVENRHIVAQGFYCDVFDGESQTNMLLGHISIAQHKVGRSSTANHIDRVVQEQRNALMQTMKNFEPGYAAFLHRSVGRSAQ